MSDKWMSFMRLPKEFICSLWNVSDVIKLPYRWKPLCMCNLLFLVAFVSFIFQARDREWLLYIEDIYIGQTVVKPKAG